MKTTKIFGALYVSTLICMILALGCQKINKQNENGKSDEFLSLKKLDSQISITNQEMEKIQNNLTFSRILYRKFDANNIYNVSSNIAVPEEIINALTYKLFGFNINAHSVVFYLNDSINCTHVSTITSNTIAAIGVYCQSEGKIIHKLFVKEADGFSEDERLFAKSTDASSSSMLFIARYYLPEDNVKSIFLLRNSKRALVSKGTDYLRVKFATRIKEYINENNLKGLLANHINAAAPTGGGNHQQESCGVETGCEDGSSWFEQCAETPLGNYRCAPIVCLLGSTEAKIIAADTLASTELSTMFNDGKCYDFRDDFLEPSYLGYKYVGYYYAISNVIADNFDISFALKMGSMLPSFYNKIDILMNPSGHESDILVNTSYRNQLTEIIDSAKDISTDTDYTAILNDLQSDLDWYEGKTVTEILACF